MRASLSAFAAFLLCLAAPAHAQDWQQRQVTIVVPSRRKSMFVTALVPEVLRHHQLARIGLSGSTPVWSTT